MERWDLYWADVPFEDDPSQKKLRPVVIMRDMVVYVLTLKVTSHDKRENDPYEYELLEWQEAGLYEPSVVRIKLSQLKPEAFHGRIGRLSAADIAGLLMIIKLYQNKNK